MVTPTCQGGLQPGTAPSHLRATHNHDRKKLWFIVRHLKVMEAPLNVSGATFCATTRETCRIPSDRACCGNAGRTIPCAHSMSQFGSNKQVQDGLKKGGPAAGPRADGQASNANFGKQAYPQPAPKSRSATIPPQLSGVPFLQLIRACKHDHPIRIVEPAHGGDTLHSIRPQGSSKGKGGNPNHNAGPIAGDSLPSSATAPSVL